MIAIKINDDLMQQRLLPSREALAPSRFAQGLGDIKQDLVEQGKQEAKRASPSVGNGMK